MKKLFLVAALMSGLQGAAQAGYQDGVDAAKAGRFDQALQEWLPLAEQGDAQAQTGIALLYLSGQGVARDDYAAVGWFRRAAEQGYAKAQYDLGVMYATGRGEWQNYRLAIEWYEKAAAQQHADAQLNLGLMFAAGEGVAQDYERAAAWYRQAAQQGNAAAMTNLGAQYYQGQGVTQNKQTAYLLFALAAAHGDENGEKNRVALARDIKPEQQAEAQQLITSWKAGSPLPQ